MITMYQRQKELIYLGLMTGKPKVITTKAYRDAVLKLQKRYFKSKKEQDGAYGSNTDILLRNAYRVKLYTKNFKLEEFRCECVGRYCTEYPKLISVQLLKNLQSVRSHFGKAITITSGVRCKAFNNSLVGSIPNSRHTMGKALDIYVSGVTDTEDGRRKVMTYWKQLKGYNYTYCNIGGSNPNMGNAVHVDVK